MTPRSLPASRSPEALAPRAAVRGRDRRPPARATLVRTPTCAVHASTKPRPNAAATGLVPRSPRPWTGPRRPRRMVRYSSCDRRPLPCQATRTRPSRPTAIAGAQPSLPVPSRRVGPQPRTEQRATEIRTPSASVCHTTVAIPRASTTTLARVAEPIRPNRNVDVGPARPWKATSTAGGSSTNHVRPGSAPQTLTTVPFSLPATASGYDRPAPARLNGSAAPKGRVRGRRELQPESRDANKGAEERSTCPAHALRNGEARRRLRTLCELVVRDSSPHQTRAAWIALRRAR